MSVNDISKLGGTLGFGRALRNRRNAPITKIEFVEPMHMMGAQPSPGQALDRGGVSAADVAKAMERRKALTEVPSEKQAMWPLPGLAPMTRVRTSFGDVHSIALRKGDKVLTGSGDYKAIVWINRISLDDHILDRKPDSNPIKISPGAIGRNLPTTEMMVSPRQMISGGQASDVPTPREAASLVTRSGVRRYRESGLTYTMFHVGETADVYCEGLYLRFALET
jgi:Hint domain